MAALQHCNNTVLQQCGISEMQECGIAAIPHSIIAEVRLFAGHGGATGCVTRLF
jgi:hypothetical protein